MNKNNITTDEIVINPATGEVFYKTGEMIENFNQGVPYTKLHDGHVKELRKLLTPTEFMLFYTFTDFLDEFNVLKCGDRYLTMQNLGELLKEKYSSIRRLIPSLIKKGVLHMYYIEVQDNTFIKVYIVNPKYIEHERFKPKYTEIFNNPKLVEINHEMYRASTRDNPEYKQWIQNSLERDNYTCQCCGSTENLEVHHILNYADHKDVRTDLNNSITLCQCCHSPVIGGSFHNIYGTRNNTQEQLDDYIKGHTQK